MSNKPVDIEFGGSKIQLPEVNGRRMAYKDAISWITRKAAEEQEAYNVHQVIECSPLDGLVAFQRAMAEIFGWVNMIPTPSMFGSIPPTLVGVRTGPFNKTEQVAFGRMSVPGIEDGFLQTGIQNEPPAFLIQGQIRKMYKPQIDAIIEKTKEMLAERSIYKGASVRVSFAWEREERDFNVFDHAPKFMDLNPEQEANLIFGERVARELEIGLFTPIEYKEACREHKIPLKRGVLLYGPYGVGKTLTANITALKANRNGWTFIYLDDVRDLKRGLEFASRYAPAVLFAEDIDRMVTGERSPEMDEILNTLDGVDTKNGEIITVFTTNHVDNINPAILRMGRLDALVEIGPPDAEAAARLVALYARGLLEPTTDLKAVGERLAGKIPAFIREVTERAKIAAIARNKGPQIVGHVAAQDLLDAAGAMETHDSFLKPKEARKGPTPQLMVQIPANHAAGRKVLDLYQKGVSENGGQVAALPEVQ